MKFTTADPTAKYCDNCSQHFALHYAGFECERVPGSVELFEAEPVLELEPAPTEEVVAAQRDKLRVSLAAMVRIHRKVGGFMTHADQTELWNAEALLVEMEGM